MASIRKRGGTWQAQVRREGHCATSKTFRTKAAAIKWARDQESRLDDGEMRAEARKEPSLRLRNLLERYEQAITRHKRGKAAERAHMGAIYRHPIANVSVKRFTPAHIANYRDDRLSVVSPSTVRREMVILLHCLRIAAEEWQYPVPKQCFSAVSRPRESAARCRRLMPGELQLILDECDNGPSYLKPLVLLALETGMRRGELLSLTWRSVDLNQGLAYLKDTKNGEERTVPLSAAARDVLLSMAGISGKVFPATPNATRLAWERMKRRAGIEDLRFHDLRHEAISHFFEIGLSLPEVALISGHKDPRMLLRYTHLTAKSVADKLFSFSKEQDYAK
ncbi:tyrosine-type recombinase/integrase [Oricola nitratireducens]|uniref:tyrosine-type recombinase/integrase n=1 Tax=Oricola nitratireducens TaxID=2775868 RepID=UPI001866CA44|nr:tyrosine-type recombinase/integrase [Oricola nitratireducens]